MRLVLKKISEEKIRALKAEAARRGITLSQAVEEAIELWLRLSNASVTVDDVVDDAVWEENKARFEKEYHGKYVVIAFGKVQGVFDSLEQVAEFLRNLKPRPRRVIVVRPGVDVSGEVREWWGGSLERM